MIKNTLQLLVLSSLAIILFGCESSIAYSTNELPESVRIVAPNFNYHDAPSDCDPVFVTNQIAKLVEAIDKKNVDDILSFFNFTQRYPFVFAWHEVTAEQKRVHFHEHEHTEFEAYLLNKFSTHEIHIELTEVHVNGWEAERNVVHYGPIYADIVINNQTEHYVMTGKGALYCESKTFAVFGLAKKEDD